VTSPFVSHGGELHLSNSAQLELLRGMAERGAPLRMTARGFSMAPFMRDRDVLTVAPLNGSEPCMGEVVAFALPNSGRLAIHRVVGRTSGGWIARGDNAPRADGVVSSAQILGHVVRVERDGRDVHLGLGPERACIAALSRSGGLAAITVLWRLPHRAVAATLRRAQALPVYRAAGRRLAMRVHVTEATRAEVAVVQRRLNPLGIDAAPSGDPNVTDWVAKRGGRVIGFVQYVVQDEGTGPWAGDWLFSLTVWGRYRGLGVGGALTQQVIDQARERGAKELLLAVSEDNTRAITLYRKLGFEQIVVAALELTFAEEKAQTGRRRIVMRKRLAGPAREPDATATT
jgi:ribosomal protein S18 acetylase RimI-like enzyme